MQTKAPYFYIFLCLLLFGLSNTTLAQKGVASSLEIDEDLAATESITAYTVYVNTASRQVELTYTLSKAEKLTLQVINEERKVVYTETLKATKEGQQRKLIDVKDYKTGSYFFQLSSAHHTYTQIANIKK